MVERLHRLREGDLSEGEGTRSRFHYEVKDMRESLDHVRKRMREVVSGISAESGSVLNLSGSVSEPSEHLSGGAAEQAANSEEIVATLDALRSITESNLRDAERGGACEPDDGAGA